MIFDYSETEPGKYKPILEIEIFSIDGKKSFTTRLIVDSGSDMTIIDERLALLIGIDLRLCTDGQAAWGIGKKKYINTKQAEVKIQFSKVSKSSTEKSRVVKSSVAFANLGDSFGVLGHVGFFEHHKIMFNARNNKFYIDHEE